jgi:hypothetical protein
MSSQWHFRTSDVEPKGLSARIAIEGGKDRPVRGLCSRLLPFQGGLQNRFANM